MTRNNTTIHTDDTGTHVVLHSTVIVTFTDETITLDSGGWHTATTKKRMNEIAEELGLGYTVTQKDFEWTVATDWGALYPFYDGMQFVRPDRMTSAA